MVVALPEPAYDPVAPAAVGGWGLSAALSDHVASFQQQTGVACRVEISLPVRLAKAQETVLYRVAQEALVNVASTPGEPRLGVVAGRQGQVALEISDNSAGFGPGHLADPPGLGHFGLASMRQRVEMAGGVVRIRSRPGQGTPSPPPCPWPGPAGRRRRRTGPHRSCPLQAAATAAEQEQHQQHDDDDQHQGTEPHLASLRVERRPTRPEPRLTNQAGRDG